jgi:ubiquinone biosynthesis protein COQ4
MTTMTERDAVAIAIHGSALERMRVGFGALLQLARTPQDTRLAFVIGAILDRNHIAKPFFRFMIDPGGFALMRTQPAIDSTTVDFAALSALPPDTLGHHYARHMRDNELDPDLFLSPPGAPPGIDYFAQRLRQTHDIWHVLTGYAADLPGEVALQAFAFGQFGTPAPGLTALFGTLRCSLTRPLAAKDAWTAYRRGKRAAFLLVVRWEDHWAEPVTSLRARFGIAPEPAVMASVRDVPHAYRVEDASLLLGLYKRVLWDRLTAKLPRALDPNVLTIASQISAVLAAASCAAALAFGPLFFALSAVCLMSCLTLDNIDGAHARLTGQCSALGEFLDHGLDGLAATSTLVTTCLLLRVEGPLMVVVCALGAVGFATTFWEQFRTGVLRLPRVSPTEGLTLLAAWELCAAVLGDPSWLRFSYERVTAGTIAIAAFVLVHVLAVLAPVVRCARAGVKARELLPLFVAAVLQVAFAVLGAKAIVPAITVGLVAADVTARLLMLRHQGERGPVIPPALYVASLPFVLQLAAPRVWTATGWAAVSLGVVASSYGATLWRHGKRLSAAAHR